MEFYCELPNCMETAYLHFDERGEPIPLTKSEWNSPLPRFRKGKDEVALLYYDNQPLFTYPVKTGTIFGLFSAIDEGLREVIDPSIRSEREKVYSLIAKFLKNKDRLHLIKKFESGKLQLLDLLGDFTGVRPPFIRENGIWVYGLDS